MISVLIGAAASLENPGAPTNRIPKFRKKLSQPRIPKLRRKVPIRLAKRIRNLRNQRRRTIRTKSKSKVPPNPATNRPRKRKSLLTKLTAIAEFSEISGNFGGATYFIRFVKYSAFVVAKAATSPPEQ